MKILLNADSANMGGALTYITNLLEVLPRVAQGERFFLVLPESTAMRFAGKVDPALFQFITYPHEKKGALHRILFDIKEIPSLIREHEIDVLFSSTGFGSLRSPCPEVLLVRNSIYFCPLYQRQLKRLQKSFQKIRSRRLMSQLSLWGADLVLFPSDAMRQLVRQHYPLASKPTRVMHYGFSPTRFFGDPKQQPPLAARMQAWRKEGKKLLLHVSSYAIQKNLEVLVEAFARVLAQGEDVKLITTLSREKTGAKEEFDRLMARIHALGLQDAIHTSEHLQYEQVWSLYHHADAFVFPSFTESFGHPLLEAMSSSLPIVASDTPVNQELCQDAAVYFKTFDVDDCTRALLRVIREDELRKSMRERSKQRAKAFSWEGYAASLLELFRTTKRLRNHKA